MKILISGFEPFGGHSMNPTQTLIKAIEDESFPGVELRTVLLPVHYDECVELLIKEIEDFVPDAVISCGLAAGRTGVTLERIAVNMKDIAPDSSYVDNKGTRPEDECINPNGPDGLFTRLPIRKMVNRLQDAEIPASISNTAGTFICNNTMYGVLDYIRIKNSSMLAGFIHFPASIEMAVENPSLPTMSQESMLKALRMIIRTTIEDLRVL